MVYGYKSTFWRIQNFIKYHYERKFMDWIYKIIKFSKETTTFRLIRKEQIKVISNDVN